MFASIDIGTNTIILLIANIENNNLITKHYESRLVRLGEDIHQTRTLKPTAIERTVNALKDYYQIIQDHHCTQVMVVATAACRMARNVLDFTSRVQEETGLVPMVIPGEEEARLTHLACKKEFEKLGHPLMVLDIGGGSTEIIVDAGEKITKQSLPLGVVTLTDKFLKSDPPTQTEIQNLRTYISSALPTPHSPLPIPLIAPAGTPTTLSALLQNLDKYDPEKVHKTKMTRKELQSITKKLTSLTLEHRSKLPCLPPKRADVIIAGAHILDVVMETHSCDSFWVSDRGLAYGVAYAELKPTTTQ